VKTLYLRLCSLAAFVGITVVLASCSRLSSPSPLPAELLGKAAALAPARQDNQRFAPRQEQSNSAYKVLHSFKGGTSDGLWPMAELYALNGVLYGTTNFGGENELGTTFTITSAGNERLIYSFGPDGEYPGNGLIALDGTLYGATAGSPSSGYCDGYGCGTVFKMTTSGNEHELYRFKVGKDGYSPSYAFSALKGALYGTTWGGGSYGGCIGYGCGTIFQVSTSGEERVLYRFKGSPDGEWPYSGMTDVNGTLYGTTLLGGTCQGSSYGCGTVFDVTASGKEHVLYSFKGPPDGEAPYGALTYVNGALYGTTSEGGRSGCNATCGTVFEVSTSGKERILYRFKQVPDANSPVAGLIFLKGAFYGTASAGGSTCDGSSFGCGAVFKVTPTGAETVLHRFKDGQDGAFPRASLTSLNSFIYGTTVYGGVGKTCGEPRCGTVFRISP